MGCVNLAPSVSPLDSRNLSLTCFFSLVVFLGLEAAVAPADTTATAVDDATSGRRESHEPDAEFPTAAAAPAGDRAAARVNCLQGSTYASPF